MSGADGFAAALDSAIPADELHSQLNDALDAHASSCTAAVIGPSGRKLQHQVIETNAKAIRKSWPQPWQ